MQETWNPKPDMTLESINAECQKNFKNIVQRSMEVRTLIIFIYLLVVQINQ